MSKFLEVGAYALAGVLTFTLYTQMNSTQERLTATRSVQLDRVELLNSAGAYAALARGTGLDYLEPEVKRVVSKPSTTSEIEQKSARCFKNRECSKLAEAIYFEDRGDVEGMKAVANVVINRTNSGKFPDTIVGVVNQKRMTKNGWVCQFSYMCQLKDRSMYDKDAKLKAGYVAWKAANGYLKDTTNGADHYLNPKLVKRMPRFAKEFEQVASINDHVFYRSL